MASRGIGVRSQFDLAVAQDHSRRDRSIGFGHRRRNGATPVLLAQPGDRPTGGRDVGHQGIGVAPTSCGGRCVLVLQPQHIARTPGGEVQ